MLGEFFNIMLINMNFFNESALASLLLVIDRSFSSTQTRRIRRIYAAQT